MASQLRSAALAVLAFTALLGIAYPFAMTGAAQLLWSKQANGSRTRADGRVVGSLLIGQDFSGSPDYFHSRPSAGNYDLAQPPASNLGPNSATLARQVRARLAAFLASESPYDPSLAARNVPVDALTASGSGVDPDISPANARIQAHRVAAIRHLPAALLTQLIRAHTEESPGELFGPPSVNVLALNLALDAIPRR